MPDFSSVLKKGKIVRMNSFVNNSHIFFEISPQFISKRNSFSSIGENALIPSNCYTLVRKLRTHGKIRRIISISIEIVLFTKTTKN